VKRYEIIGILFAYFSIRPIVRKNMSTDRKKLAMMRKRGGFTLIELMIVVMVLAILSSFAIPLYVNYKAGAMQSEARILLEGIWTSEISYYSDKSVYTDNYNLLGANPIEDSKFYKNWELFVYPLAVPQDFIATCSTNLDRDVFLDTWIVSSDTTLTDGEKILNSFSDVRNR
jgi:prepilin-type N-terminal cleavage/methylation domain-containing protein